MIIGCRRIMYVCICQGITDKQIKAAVSAGASSLDDLRTRLSVANCCGQCSHIAQQIIEETLCRADSDELYYQVA